MSDQNHQYEIGHWVVHSQYGVGQIKEIESVPLYGDMQNKEKCFTVQTKEGVFWFPVEQSDNPRVRPITTKTSLNNALKIFQEPPEDTDAHHNVIKGRINTAQTDGSLTDSIRLVRDLSARHNQKKLNILEDRALKLHTDRLILEWSLCMKIEETEALKRLNKLLQQAEG
jgi:RNA polymerase-interacting CarD/CdnL/TRCF family regulator